MGQITKIDWADSSWNPITGCLHGCEYCYARRHVRRFGGQLGSDGGNHFLVLPRREVAYEDREKIEGRVLPYPYGFDPTFHRYRLEIPQHWKKPRNIFVCSVADMFGEWVPDEWIMAVFAACDAAPQHRYLFLTKNPGRLLVLAESGRLPEKKNYWYGCSVPKQGALYFNSLKHNTFVSIEPILESFDAWNMLKPNVFPDWIIVGGETGNRRGKVIPSKEWIDTISRRAYTTWKTPVFMKESLRRIMGEDFRQEFPWEV